VRNIALMRRAAERNVRSTRGFTASITNLALLARQHPTYPVLLQSGDPADFEPLTSYPRFLIADGVTNEMYLLWIPSRHGVANYAGSMSAQLVEDARTGVPGRYLPIDRLGNPDDKCILILLGGTARLPCQFVVSGDWHRYY
jgi:hypothetical protein